MPRAQRLRGAPLLPAARGSPLRSGTNRLRRGGAVRRGHTIDRDVADGVAGGRREARRGADCGAAPSAEAGDAAVARSLETSSGPDASPGKRSGPDARAPVAIRATGRVHVT